MRLNLGEALRAVEFELATCQPGRSTGDIRANKEEGLFQKHGLVLSTPKRPHGLRPPLDPLLYNLSRRVSSLSHGQPYLSPAFSFVILLASAFTDNSTWRRSLSL